LPFFQDVKGNPSKKNTNPLLAIFRQDANELLENLYCENKKGVYKHLYLFGSNADSFINEHYRYVVFDGVH